MKLCYYTYKIFFSFLFYSRYPFKLIFYLKSFIFHFFQNTYSILVFFLLYCNQSGNYLKFHSLKKTENDNYKISIDN